MAIYKRSGTKNYLYDFTVDGRRYRGSTKTSVRSAAKERESALILEIKESGRISDVKRCPTLVEYSERFLDWVDNSQRLEEPSRQFYRLGWKYLRSQRIASMRIDKIATEDAEIVKVPGSPSTHNCALRTLRRMLNLAMNQELIRKAPRIHLMEENRRTQMIDIGREQLIAHELSSPRYWGALKIAMYLILDMGMRPKEIVSTSIKHVDFISGLLYIPKSKTRAGERYLPMTARVKDKLFKHIGARSEGWVFPSPKIAGSPIQRNALTKAWRRVCNNVGLPSDVNLYCARHQFATDAMTATKNPFLVMRLLGHTELKMTERYQHHEITPVGELMDERNRLRHSLRHSGQVIN